MQVRNALHFVAKNQYVCSRCFSTSDPLQRQHHLLRGNRPMRTGKWREQHDVPAGGNEYGPLVDLPDFRFADGTPAPLGRGQKERLEKQERQTQRIQFLMKEVNSAIATAKQNRLEKLETRRNIIESKLTEKGFPLNRKSSGISSESSEFDSRKL